MAYLVSLIGVVLFVYQLFMLGAILPDNNRYFPSTTDYASQNGIGFIARGLNEKDILENLSFSDNLFLPVIKKTCKYKFIIDNSVLKFIEREYSAAVGIQESDKKKALINFDQYTIQSVLLYRWILHKPKILACIEPFSNADIFMRQMVSSAFEELTAKGAGIIISSSDLSELSNICDSIIVFSNKRIVGKFSCDNIDEIRTFAINEYEKTH